jgi:hypothetical protein
LFLTKPFLFFYIWNTHRGICTSHSSDLFIYFIIFKLFFQYLQSFSKSWKFEVVTFVLYYNYYIELLYT